jgi:AraC-like DNA-binding protein
MVLAGTRTPQPRMDEPDERKERNEFLHVDGLLPGVVSTVVGYCSSGAPEGVHRGLPSPYLTFIFSLHDPIVSATVPEQLDTADAASTSIVTGGLHTTPAYIRQPSAQTGIQLAVHPLAARRLFGASTAELTGSILDGLDVLGAESERLRMRLVETPSWDQRFMLLREFLRRRVTATENQQRVRAEVAEAWTWMARHRGTGSIDGLARHVLLSRRQLNTLFAREVGLSPKSVSRLMRFQQAIRHITSPVRDGTSADLAQVAADCGYFDQSHLIRDFRQFSGTSPSRWLAEERRNIQAGGHRNGDG